MDINYAKEKVCNGGLIILSILAIPALIASLARVPSVGWQPIMYLHIIIVSVVLLLTFFRHRCSYNVRSYAIIGAIFIVGAGELFSFGIFGSGWPYLAHAAIIGMVFFDTKKSIIIFVFGSLLIALSFMAFKNQTLMVPVNINSYFKNASTWINYYTDYLLIYSTIIAAFYFINNALLQSTQELKQLNESLESKVEERTKNLTEINIKLNKSLEEIKTLRGIIPICMYCKGIRDDKGAWNQLEKYITEHSEAQFSHGICDKCEEKYISEYMENE